MPSAVGPDTAKSAVAVAVQQIWQLLFSVLTQMFYDRSEF